MLIDRHPINADPLRSSTPIVVRYCPTAIHDGDEAWRCIFQECEQVKEMVEAQG